VSTFSPVSAVDSSAFPTVPEAPITVTDLHALEILDSRGRPTLAVTLATADGATVQASVPSGASTGTREAVELRDGDTGRYEGRGVQDAVANVNGPIADLLRDQVFGSQAELDQALIDVDGTATKSGLGANAIVGVSLAAARAFAAAADVPLWRSLVAADVVPCLPVPYFNVVNGGAHAPNKLDFQEFMIAPVGAPTITEAVRAGAEVYGYVRRILSDRGHAVGLGDEGGFAPNLDRPEDILDMLVEAITAAGYEPGRGITIALDPAASEFYRDGAYHVAGNTLSATQMIDWYDELTGRYPISSVEDGLAEDDWQGWIGLTARLGARVQLVGDDIFVTDPATIGASAGRGIANAALIKVNQIGTVCQTLNALRVCREVGYAAMISHRSGETPDTFIADLAVGSGCGQIKSGAPARGERVAKYNRLMEVAAGSPQLGFGTARKAIRV
jgi:enolase